MEATEEDDQQTATEEMGGSETKKLPRGLNDKRNKHQIFITSLYNKAVMLHLSPQTGEIFIHELDPSMIFKYS